MSEQGSGERTTGLSPNDGPAEETGAAIPPYDGRQTGGEVDTSGSRKDGANVGGATGPVADDTMKASSPSDTAGDRAAAPGGEPPKTEEDASYEADPGVGPAHEAGTPKGEDEGA